MLERRTEREKKGKAETDRKANRSGAGELVAAQVISAQSSKPGAAAAGLRALRP